MNEPVQPRLKGSYATSRSFKKYEHFSNYILLSKCRLKIVALRFKCREYLNNLHLLP